MFVAVLGAFGHFGKCKMCHGCIFQNQRAKPFFYVKKS